MLSECHAVFLRRHVVLYMTTTYLDSAQAVANNQLHADLGLFVDISI